MKSTANYQVHGLLRAKSRASCDRNVEIQLQLLLYIYKSIENRRDHLPDAGLRPDAAEGPYPHRVYPVQQRHVVADAFSPSPSRPKQSRAHIHGRGGGVE